MKTYNFIPCGLQCFYSPSKNFILPIWTTFWSFGPEQDYKFRAISEDQIQSWTNGLQAFFIQPTEINKKQTNKKTMAQLVEAARYTNCISEEE